MKKVLMMAYCLLLSVVGVMAATPEVVATTKVMTATELMAATEVVTANAHQETQMDGGDYVERLYSADGRYMFEFDILEEVKVGVKYTFEQHMDETYSGCTDYESREKFFFRTATFEMTMQEELRHIDASATLVDGRSFTITYQEREEVIAKDTVQLVANIRSVMDMTTSFGDMATITAENSEYSVDLWLQPITSMYGTFTEADLKTAYSPIVKLKNGKAVGQATIIRAELTITKVGIDPVVKGWLLGSNDVLYVVDFRYALPKPKRQVTLNVPEGNLTDASERMHYIEAEGFDESEKYYVTLVYVTKTLREGKYLREDLHSTYSIVSDYSGETEKNYVVLGSDIELSIGENDVVTVQGSLITYDTENHDDVVEYVVNMTCGVDHRGQKLDYDAEDEDYEKTFGTDMFALSCGKEGEVRLEAYDKEDMSFAMIQMYLPDTVDVLKVGIPDGVYEVRASGEVNTVQASQGVVGTEVYPSYVGHMQADGKIAEPIWFLVAGTVTVTSDEEHVLVSVEGTNSYGRKIHVTMDSQMQKEGVEEVSTEKREARKEMREGRVVIVSGENVYGLMGSKLLDEGRRP